MNTILRIFKHDVKGICRNMFALIIALGLCIIPSLYAWFNIYSNWDPYANTSSIKLLYILKMKVLLLREKKNRIWVKVS